MKGLCRVVHLRGKYIQRMEPGLPSTERKSWRSPRDTVGTSVMQYIGDFRNLKSGGCRVYTFLLKVLGVDSSSLPRDCMLFSTCYRSPGVWRSALWGYSILVVELMTKAYWHWNGNQSNSSCARGGAWSNQSRSRYYFSLVSKELLLHLNATWQGGTCWWDSTRIEYGTSTEYRNHWHLLASSQSSKLAWSLCLVWSILSLSDRVQFTAPVKTALSMVLSNCSQTTA